MLALLPLTSSFVTLAGYEQTAAPDMEDQRRAVEDHTVKFKLRWSEQALASDERRRVAYTASMKHLQRRTEGGGAAVRHSLGGNRWPDRPCRGELATTFTTTFLCLVLQGITGENAATFSLQVCCSYAAGTVQLRVWPCTCNPFAALCILVERPRCTELSTDGIFCAARWCKLECERWDAVLPTTRALRILTAPIRRDTFCRTL